MSKNSSRPVAGLGALALVLACRAGACAPSPVTPRPSVPALPEPVAMAPPTEVAPGQTFVVAAAGDVAGVGHAHGATADLLVTLAAARRLAAILALGDLQYPRGTLAEFMRDYDASWGRAPLRALTRPVPGNHEYDHGRSDADGYFDYWNGPGAATGPAGVRGLGYYSFDMGDWHLVALNTSDGCRGKVPCDPGLALHRWLVADLAAHGRRCVLAFMHHPRFQQGAYHEDTPRVAPLWDALYEGGADVVIAAHEHNFQQLAPLDKAGGADPRRGIRSFVVGTGGARPYLHFLDGAHAHAGEARVAGRFGVLELELGPGRYAWRFVATGAAPGGETLRSGQDACR